MRTLVGPNQAARFDNGQIKFSNAAVDSYFWASDDWYDDVSDADLREWRRTRAAIGQGGSVMRSGSALGAR